MRWHDKITLQEHKHLREMGVTTLTQAKKNAEAQKKMRDDSPNGIEPCWDCKCINWKLGLPT